MLKQRVIYMMLVLCLLLLVNGCGTKSTSSNNLGQAISIIDDSGKTVALKKPAVRIISLYSGHTDNLIDLGLDKEIIGVSKSETNPLVQNKPVFDYRADPEHVLAANPDLVLIRPFIRQSNPQFVQALENAGIAVVTLYPEKFEDFDSYINKLGLLTGKAEIAKSKLAEFHAKLAALEKQTAGVKTKARVFIETTSNDYKTVTVDSLPARILAIAGGINIAEDAKSIRLGSSIADYGAERLLSHAAEIDVYVAQYGTMNRASIETICTRPGFNHIKAIQNGRVYLIDENEISRPTFKLLDGAYHLAHALYPDLITDLGQRK